ncbi:MAG: NAD-dependent epimerase [Paracoccaceae bacterium]
MPPETADLSAVLATDRPVLVTGAAGFIGYHLSERLLSAGLPVTGVDNLSPYYDPQLKRARLDRLARHRGFRFFPGDVADLAALDETFEATRPAHVVHLAAQAGVRHSIEAPHEYGSANLTGFLNILELCRHHRPQHLVFASSSSVYGGNTRLPYSVDDSVDHPVSLYAATKRANELMAHSYAHLYGIPVTGLRFFTVYGPWGRPDMAYFKFTKAIFEGQRITLYNGGDMSRDFTFIDDINEGLVRLLGRPPQPNPAFNRADPARGRSWAPYRIFNIGNNRSQPLLNLIETLEEIIGREADKSYAPMQPGDVQRTWAEIDDLTEETGFQPDTPLRLGLERFVDWYRSYYGAD